ncbi:MAG: hypothetical protein KBT01_03460, partial [Clostridiales bacterium]|nr:hypothetical protein [Candidatus Blautia equi]
MRVRIVLVVYNNQQNYEFESPCRALFALAHMWPIAPAKHQCREFTSACRALFALAHMEPIV